MTKIENKIDQSIKPKGIEFYDRVSKRELIWVYDENDTWANWIFYKHPDGQWVSLRKIKNKEKEVLLSLLHG